MVDLDGGREEWRFDGGLTWMEDVVSDAVVAVVVVGYRLLLRTSD
jgi:hypothetical protein